MANDSATLKIKSTTATTTSTETKEESTVTANDTTIEIQGKKYPISAEATDLGIVLISEEAYNELPEEAPEKEDGTKDTSVLTQDDYIIYNPSSDPALASYISKMQAINDVCSKMAPMMTLMRFMPNPSPAMTIKDMVKPLENIQKTLDAIDAVTSSILRPLVKPIVAFIKNLFQIIGLLLAIVTFLNNGKKFTGDVFVKTCEAVDWEGLGNSIQKLTSSSTGSLKDSKADINLDSIPDAKVKKEIKEATEELDKMVNEQIVPLYETSKIIKTFTDTVMKNMTYEQFFKQRIKGVSKNLGINVDLLEPSPEALKLQEFKYPDPGKVASKCAKSINKMACQLQYIKTEDNELLKDFIKKKAEIAKLKAAVMEEKQKALEKEMATMSEESIKNKIAAAEAEVDKRIANGVYTNTNVPKQVFLEDSDDFKQGENAGEAYAAQLDSNGGYDDELLERCVGVTKDEIKDLAEDSTAYRLLYMAGPGEDPSKERVIKFANLYTCSGPYNPIGERGVSFCFGYANGIYKHYKKQHTFWFGGFPYPSSSSFFLNW